jgi:formylglycine-generating enzyme required for sulfatase activity
MRIRTLIIALMVGAFIFGQAAFASNVTVANVTLVPCADSGQTFVQCDVSWDASWRASWTESGSWTNWDAAWIFVKYRTSSTGVWSHATLSTNVVDYTAPAGSTISVGLSTNSGGTNFGCGVFLYRSNEGSGSWTNSGVKLRWRYADDGVANTARVDVSVHAIEMVYVPQGSFYAGDGTTTSVQAQFCSNTTGTVAFQITNENYTITLGGGGADSLGNNNASGMNTPADDFNNGTPQTLPAAFPKGYNAFYCMKYEISEGQWVSFFNMLTDSQKATRDITSNVNGGKNSDGVVGRNTVAWTTGDATSAAPDRACNYLSWADGTAYADWAGLRPMTELEFEKACRGPLTPVANEYAWGSTAVTDITGFSGTDGSGTETASPANANCNYGNNGIFGPVRCGIYATSTSGREASGATYWGIMDMSGNLWERPVTVGNTTGRAFAGSLGDGKLNTTGDANADYWPGTSASGAGFRGGSWDVPTTTDLRSSQRISAAYVAGNRSGFPGFRAARPAPSGGQ